MLHHVTICKPRLLKGSRQREALPEDSSTCTHIYIYIYIPTRISLPGFLSRMAVLICVSRIKHICAHSIVSI